jgi:hypothetical protein
MNYRSAIACKFRTAAVATVAVIMLSACASAQPPVEAMAVAESAVQRANTADTRTGAPAQLQIAIAKLDSARSAVEREDFLLAGQLAKQAQVDAELAEVMAQTSRAELAARESQAAAQVLRDELNP